MEANSRPMKNMMKWPLEIMKYMPRRVKSTTVWNSPILMRFSALLSHFEDMRKTTMTPMLSTLLTMVIMGVCWYIPPKAEAGSSEPLQQGRRLRAVCTSSRMTGNAVRKLHPQEEREAPSAVQADNSFSSFPQRKRSARNRMTMTARRLSSSVMLRNCV